MNASVVSALAKSKTARLKREQSRRLHSLERIRSERDKETHEAEDSNNQYHLEMKERNEEKETEDDTKLGKYPDNNNNNKRVERSCTSSSEYGLVKRSETIASCRSRASAATYKRSSSIVEEIYNSFFPSSTISRKSTVQDRKIIIDIGWKEKIFLVLDDAQCCGLAKIVSICMMVVIVLSCVTYVISSDPSIRKTPSSCEKPTCHDDPDLCPGKTICEPVPPEVFDVIEMYCIIVFTLDYGARVLLVPFMNPRIAGVISMREELDAVESLSEPEEGEEVDWESCRDPELPPLTILLRYLVQPMNIIDVVAIVPFYIELGTSSGSSISIVRVLRLARMLRIFKASKYNEGTRLLSNTIWRSLPALSLLFFFTALGVVLFGSLIFFMEAGEYEVTPEHPSGAYYRTNEFGAREVSPFTSIPVSCYWVIVTATTVGFGDLYPTSGGGRLVACVCMYIGLLVLALPITVVGSNFTIVYEERQEMEEEKERLKQLQDDKIDNGRSLFERQASSSSVGGISQLTPEALAYAEMVGTGQAPAVSTPRRGNASNTRNPSTQTLHLMKQQLLVQQAHMRHLHELQHKVEQERDRDKENKDLSSVSLRSNAFRKHFRKVKKASKGNLKIRRKSTGNGGDGYTEVSDSSINNNDDDSNNQNKKKRDRALSLDTSLYEKQSHDISPHSAMPNVVISPFTTLNTPTSTSSEHPRSPAVNSARHLCSQISELFNHLHSLETVVAVQRRQLAEKEKEIAALTKLSGQSMSSVKASGANFGNISVASDRRVADDLCRSSVRQKALHMLERDDRCSS